MIFWKMTIIRAGNQVCEEARKKSSSLPGLLRWVSTPSLCVPRLTSQWSMPLPVGSSTPTELRRP